jgi:hypothetical protein
MVALGYETEEEEVEGSSSATTESPSSAATDKNNIPAPAVPVIAAEVIIEKEPVQEQLKTNMATSPSEDNRYPTGLFKEQGLRAVYVTAGTPFLVIAQQYKIPLARLFEWNNLTPTTEAPVSQVLFLEKKTKSVLRLPSLRSRL